MQIIYVSVCLCASPSEMGQVICSRQWGIITVFCILVFAFFFVFLLVFVSARAHTYTICVVLLLSGECYIMTKHTSFWHWVCSLYFWLLLLKIPGKSLNLRKLRFGEVENPWAPVTPPRQGFFIWTKFDVVYSNVFCAMHCSSATA